MKLIAGIKSIQQSWSNHRMPEFEEAYEAICGAFARRESGPISPPGMEEELRDARLKLILLRYASCDPLLTEAVFNLSDPTDWDTLPTESAISRRAFYCLRETNSSMTTNGPTAAPKTYSFGPWFETFRRHVERMTYAQYGLGFRRMNVSIDPKATKPSVEQIASPSGEITEVKMDAPSLIRRVGWLADHAKEFHYDQITVPAAIVSAIADIWKGGNIEVISGGTALYPHEARMAAEVFGHAVIDSMRCWDGGFTFGTNLEGNRIALSDFFCWKVVDNKVRTVDLFNHATPFVNYESDDEIVMDGHKVVSIRKSFEDVPGIDPEVIGPELAVKIGFWQILSKAGKLHVFPKEAAPIVEEMVGQSVEPVLDPVGIGIRDKLYHVANLDLARNHGRLVPA